MNIRRDRILRDKIEPLPTKYRVTNSTGFFDVRIYLNNNYKVRYCGHIKTNEFDVSGELKLQIYRNGNVCIWYSYPFADYKDLGLKKYATGYVLDIDKAEEICDYIDALQGVSDYMKEKHLKKRISGQKKN